MVRAADQVRARRMSLPTAGPSAPILPIATIRTAPDPLPVRALGPRCRVRSIARNQERLTSAATAAADAQSRRPGCLHIAAALHTPLRSVPVAAARRPADLLASRGSTGRWTRVPNE